MPKNRDVLRSSAECDEHVKAVDKRRAKLDEDRRHDEMRQLREVLRDEQDGSRVPEWQVKRRGISGQGQAADE